MRTPSVLPQVIGIDVGTRAIKAAQWTADPQRSPRTVSVLRTSDGPVPAPADAQRLVAAMDRRGFRGRRTVLALPEPLLKTTLLSLPPRSSGAPIDSLARSEMQDTLGDGQEFTMALWDLPPRSTSGMGTDVSVVACLRTDLDPLIDVFEHAGLEVEGVDVAHCSAPRMALPGSTDDADLTVLVDIGHSSTRVTLLLGRVVVYHRKLTIGGVSVLHHDLATRFGIDPSCAPYLTATRPRPDQPWCQAVRSMVGSFLTGIGRDIETALSYGLNSYRDAQPARLCLIGGGGEIDGAAEFLGELLGLPVHPPDAAVRPIHAVSAAVALRDREAAA